MKKLALVIASLALAAAPVFACPHEDKAQANDEAPRTAEKAKEQPKAKAKEAEKAPVKTAKPAEKKPEKVSSK